MIARIIIVYWVIIQCNFFSDPPLYQQLAVIEYGYFVGSEFSLMLSLEDGVPASTFAWEKDNEELEESQGITLTSNSITIGSVSNVDQGNYNVTASNSAGEDSVSFDLLVYCKLIDIAGNWSINYCRF